MYIAHTILVNHLIQSQYQRFVYFFRHCKPGPLPTSKTLHEICTPKGAAAPLTGLAVDCEPGEHCDPSPENDFGYLEPRKNKVKEL